MAGNASPLKMKTGKRLLPALPDGFITGSENLALGSPSLKSVTFSSEVIETSIGGTQSYGRMKFDPLSPSINIGNESENTSMIHDPSLSQYVEINISQDNRIASMNVDCNPTSVSMVIEPDLSVDQPRDCDNDHMENDHLENDEKQSENSPPQTDIPKSITPKPMSSSSTKKLSKDTSDITSSQNSRKARILPRSKTISCCLKADMLPDKIFDGNTTSNNLMNLDPMGDSPTKIPVLARRSAQSYPDGQLDTPRDSHSATTGDNTATGTPTIRASPRVNLLTANTITPVRRHTLDKMPITPEFYSHVQFETPRPGTGSSNESLMDIDEMSEISDREDSCSVMVAVRVRPFSQRELSDTNVRCVVGMLGNQTTVTPDSGHCHRFLYDFSFWSFDDEHGDFASQDHVYSCLAQPLLGKAFEGYNTCLFAYGQTGSGKSYSIMGHGSEVGIIPRFSEELFARMDLATSQERVKMNVEISFFEIYNEKIHDLLASSKEKTGKKALKVREHPVLGPYVEGLSTFVVNSFEDVQGWITLGNKSRATAATGMNDKSSRSHSVFTLVLTQTRSEFLEGQDHDHSITSKINLVDLAGSERQSQAQTSGERLREGANINKSLLTLGKVISTLSEQSANRRRKVFIPYRDSVLTWLLKESLGGNSKTAMIATISPANHHTEETLSTLRYAKQARSIVNIVRVNEDPKARLIRELRGEIDKLRCQTGVMNDVAHAASLAEIASLKDKLTVKEKEMEEASRSWNEKLQRSVARKEEELRTLEKAGVSFKVDNKLPNLVNLNEDPQLSEMLLYVIKEGQTQVGRMRAKSTHDIQLNGALIADDHCIIDNVNEAVTVTPIGDAPTYVNGNMVLEATILHHGDRVILGGDHYFRFNHPIEVQKQKKSNTAGCEIKDFEFAKQELMQVQESRLQEELEEAKRKAQEEMLHQLEKVKKEAEQEFKAQKTGYEGKLANLESSLKYQNVERQKAEEAKWEAEELINKLKKQKMLLEQEVIAGKKRHQVETFHTAQAKVNGKTHSERSKLLELLESEKKKMAQKLEEVKQRRTELPSPSKKLKVSALESGKTDLYKIALLLREANKISQYLKKHTVFSREDVLEEEQLRTFIKVVNKKLGISTFWSLSKFESKLMAMRDIYQGDSDSTDDEVFYDPKDNWEKENGLNSPNSPRLVHGSRSSTGSRRHSFGTPILNSTRTSSIEYRAKHVANRADEVQILQPNFPKPMKTELLFTSEDSNDSANAPRNGDLTCDASHRSNSGTEMHRLAPSPVLPVCRDLLTVAMARLQVGVRPEESIADEVLLASESLRQSVTTILDTSMVQSGSISETGDKTVLERHTIAIIGSFNVLVSVASLWSSLYDALDSALIQELTEKIRGQVRTLGSQMVLFFQGCENEIDTMVQESGAKMTDSLYSLCKYCGELALATDTPMATLYTSGETTEGEESSTAKLSEAVRQAFVGGCDVFVDKTLQGGIKTLEDCELKAQNYSEEASTNILMLGEVPKHVEVVVATSKVLLLKCQEIQVEIDTTLRESSCNRPGQYYQHNYTRSQNLISNISCLVDSISLIIQATEPVVQGAETDLRKLCRCSDMIQKAASKLLAVSRRDSMIGQLPLGSVQSDLSDLSLLSDYQLDQMDFAVQEVKLASTTLSEQVQKVIDSERAGLTPSRGINGEWAGLTSGRGKRILPVSPDKVTPMPVLQAKNRTLWKSISLADGQTTSHRGDDSSGS